MATFGGVCAAFIIATLSLTMQGCEKSNLCKQSLPLLGPLTCKLASVGTGGCKDLKGASVSKADSVATCQELCAKKKGCKYYSFCTDPDDKKACSALYRGACGLIANDKCKLATSLARDGLTTFQMYDANMHTPHSQTAQTGIGFMLGLAAAGAFAMIWLRVGRRSVRHQDMELLEEVNCEE